MLCIYENCEYQVNKLNNESHCVAVVLRASAGSDILLYSLVLCLLKCSLYSIWPFVWRGQHVGNSLNLMLRVSGWYMKENRSLQSKMEITKEDSYRKLNMICKTRKHKRTKIQTHKQDTWKHKQKHGEDSHYYYSFQT